MSGKDAALQSRLRLIGTGILVAGMLAATLVDLTAKPDDGSATADYKRDEYQMEYMGGDFPRRWPFSRLGAPLPASSLPSA